MNPPLSKIASIRVDVFLTDNKGAILKGSIDPWGKLQGGLVSPAETPDEMLARFASMAFLNGTSAEVIHNIVNEGLIRARERLAYDHRSPAV